MIKYLLGLSQKELARLLTCLTLITLFVAANLYYPALLPYMLRFPATCKPLTRTRDVIASGAGNSMSASATASSSTPTTYRYPDVIRRSYDQHFNEHSYIPRFLNQQQHQAAVSLLTLVRDLFRQHNVTFIIHHGTLLGSYMFHDIIPWDDDMDIIVSFRDVNRVRRLLRQPQVAAKLGAVSYTESFNLYSQENIVFDADLSRPYGCLTNDVTTDNQCLHKFHLYRTDSQKTSMRGIGFPYIDVKFYTENSTHIWPLDRKLDGYTFMRRDFYPLVFRPLFNEWFPAPKHTHKWLKCKFAQFKCSSKWYSHHSQSIAIGYHSKCSSVKSCYPYVQRLPYCSSCERRDDDDDDDSNGMMQTMEQLRIGDDVIHQVVSEEEYLPLEPLTL